MEGGPSVDDGAGHSISHPVTAQKKTNKLTNNEEEGEGQLTTPSFSHTTLLLPVSFCCVMSAFVLLFAWKRRIPKSPLVAAQLSLAIFRFELYSSLRQEFVAI
ncbi:hypothetical protein Nepgr_019786 [Nepenthes gracilis]|uniref:Uncharacterized protein n=1 Tax=Nepenthes gracilis TaxID=150966 RepID=A0AAD3SU99_NEPGR|nr:hypothetical protein Nepgr_019786 [Nepenthes gracilis]